MRSIAGVGLRKEEGQMGHKTTYFAVALSFMIVLTPRVMSPGADESHRTWEAPAGRGIGGSHKAIGPPLQNDYPTPDKKTHRAGLKPPGEDLSELEEAEQFMQLKAAVYADLDRLDKSRGATPQPVVVRDAGLDYQGTEKVAVNRANGTSIRESPGPIR
jgi:hypothetical protein